MKITQLFLFSFCFSLSNAWSQWTPQTTNTTAHLMDVTFVDANIGFAVGQNGIVLKTEDGGMNWSAVSSPNEKSTLRSVLAISADTILVAEQNIFNGQVYQSVNGGQSWKRVTGGAYLASAQSGIQALSYDTLHQSTDGGTQWSAHELNLGGTLLMEQLEFPEDTLGYIMGNVSGFAWYSAFGFRTINGGNTWEPLLTPDLPNSYSYTNFSAPHSDTAYLFNNEQVNFLPGANNYLIRLTGFYFETFQEINSWRFKGELVNDNMPGYMSASKFLNGSIGYAGSYNGSIYRTGDGGVNWQAEYTGQDTIHQIRLRADGTIFAVGSNGLILQRSLVNSTSSKNEILPVAVFPNPAASFLTVPSIPATAAVARIMHINGQVVRTFNWRQGDQIEVSRLASGMYLLELRANGTIYRTKFQKL